MTTNEVQSVIRSYIASRSVEKRRESATFLAWFLEYIFGLDKDQAIACICDEMNDKGIDAIFVDELEEEIHVFQSKLKEADNCTIGDKSLREFAGVKEWFKSSETIAKLQNESTINKELQALLSESNIETIIDSYDTKYHFVTNASNDANTKEFSSVTPDIEIWNIERIADSYHEIKNEPYVSDTVVFDGISKNSIILIPDIGGNKMATFPLSANEVLKLKGIDDLTLFNNNVRFGLGNTRVNKAIQKTLQTENERDKFLIFHNGLSIVCEEFEYDKNKSSIAIKNYSIVNGAQSTITFFKNQKILTDDVKVFARIIQVGKNQALSDLITYYSNNQNAISMKDLRSNDKTQTRLTSQFKKIDDKYHTMVTYVPKKGQLVPTGYDAISSDYAAQLITSCYLQKPHETHLKTSMFDARYNSIFSHNITAAKLYIYYKCHQLLQTALGGIDDQKIAAYGLAQHLLLSTLFAILSSDTETQAFIVDQDLYLNDQQKYDSFLSKVITLLIKVFNHEIKELKKDPDFVYKNYFKNKDVISLQAKLKTLFATSLSINETTLGKMLT